MAKQPSDLYFIKDDAILTILQFQNKIKRMYDVLLTVEEKPDNKINGCWLNLEGEHGDRKNAKTYINALCQPEKKWTVQLPAMYCEEFTDSETLEQIEKHAHAFIRPLGDIAKFEIAGTDLSISLVVSKMEELAESALRKSGKDIKGLSTEVICDGFTKISAPKSRLSDALQRVLSENSDGICSVDDYANTTPAVQRVLVNCLQDDIIDDDLLFASGVYDGRTSNLKIFIEDSHSRGTDVTEVDGDVIINQNTDISPTVVNLTDKVYEATISNDQDDDIISEEQQTYLKNFGITNGFREEVVMQALHYVDKDTRPSDFIEQLDSLCNNKINKSAAFHDSDDDAEIIDLTDDNSKYTVKTSGDTAPCQNADTTTGIKSDFKPLPDDYTKRLIHDFHTEDESCSMEDLKRRNAERQKILSKQFEKERKSSNVGTAIQGQNSKKQNLKGKQRKKRQSGTNDNKLSDSNKLHDKKLTLDSESSRTYSNDLDQTCVLKFWKSDKGSNNDPCIINPKDQIQTTPKRKQSKGNKKCSEPTASTGEQQHQTYKYQGPQPSTSQPDLRIDQCFTKPIQVVSPVSILDTITGVSRQLPASNDSNLRYIVIDGSNVAMTHGNGKFFSCKGIRICVDYFKQRGHDKITVFVPHWRQCRPSSENTIMDQHILNELQQEEVLVFTPSRKVGGRLVVSYDDRFVLELAEAEDGIIVSNDQYRDLMYEKAAWRRVIEERLLMYSFVRDRFMPPNDPLGRVGPVLADFLRVSAKKPISSGNSHWHPMLMHNKTYQHQPQSQEQKGFVQQNYPQTSKHSCRPQGETQRLNLDMGYDEMDGGQPNMHMALQEDTGYGKGNWASNNKGYGYGNKGVKQISSRRDDETQLLFKELREIFPEAEQEEIVRNVLSNHDGERDKVKLTNYCLSVLDK